MIALPADSPYRRVGEYIGTKAFDPGRFRVETAR